MDIYPVNRNIFSDVDFAAAEEEVFARSNQWQ
jgi:hypothetical protein